jgi:HpcH/HpaI aldolase/citrate lyase family protein
MIELLQITNDPDLARRCDAIAGMRLFVDLERHGKAERQAGRNTFISTHVPEDVARIKAVLRRAPLMVRVDPVAGGGIVQADAAIASGADMLMLPMFTEAGEVQVFCAHVAGRAQVVALLETRQALESLPAWIATPGLREVYVGLNDLHLSLGCRFMFEPLASGMVDRVAAAARAQGLRFGFGGIARLDEGLLPGRDVLAEHVRLGSDAVILSRTFHGTCGAALRALEAEIAALRACETALRGRTAAQVEADRLRIGRTIGGIAGALKGTT